MKEPYRIYDLDMPVVLGSALKVPSYAYQNWGVKGNRKLSEQLYAYEWEGGSAKQMQYVIHAITKTNLGNFSQILREAASNCIIRLFQNSTEYLSILETGAGISTVTLFKKMLELDLDVDRVGVSMFEPSKNRLNDAIDKLERLGLKKHQHFDPIVAKDTDVLRKFFPESFDIAFSVASIHHHAYLDFPLSVIFRSLKRGAFLIISDWHNSMWEHPNRVFNFLNNSFEWETKDRDLDAFLKMYPNAITEANLVSSLDESANELIRQFWTSWSKVRAEAIRSGTFDPNDDILMLEGHRPVEKQIEEMELIGFNIESDGLIDENPKQILTDSRILMMTIGKKPI